LFALSINLFVCLSVCMTMTEWGEARDVYSQLSNHVGCLHSFILVYVSVKTE